MKKLNFKSYLGISFISVLLFISGCDKRMSQETGFLEGVITIGPVCPVETDPPDPGCLPTAETYKAYPVSVWTSDRMNKIAQLNPALDGSFIVELAAGKYLVILENLKQPGGSSLPAEISITQDNKTILDINIDTGIR